MRYIYLWVILLCPNVERSLVIVNGDVKKGGLCFTSRRKRKSSSFFLQTLFRRINTWIKLVFCTVFVVVFMCLQKNVSLYNLLISKIFENLLKSSKFYILFVIKHTNFLSLQFQKVKLELVTTYSMVFSDVVVKSVFVIRVLVRPFPPVQRSKTTMREIKDSL